MVGFNYTCPRLYFAVAGAQSVGIASWDDAIYPIRNLRRYRGNLACGAASVPLACRLAKKELGTMAIIGNVRCGKCFFPCFYVCASYAAPWRRSQLASHASVSDCSWVDIAADRSRGFLFPVHGGRRSLVQRGNRQPTHYIMREDGKTTRMSQRRQHVHVSDSTRLLLCFLFASAGPGGWYPDSNPLRPNLTSRLS